MRPTVRIALLWLITAPAALAQGFAAGEVPALPDDGGPRLFAVTGIEGHLNLRSAPSTSGEVMGQVGPGDLVSNLGCSPAEGRTWCDVQPFRGGPRGYAAAEFLMGAISPDGAVATGPDDSALRAGEGDFDATGSVTCAMTPDAAPGDCAFGVARAGGGWATVVITRPEGPDRVLFFANGVFVAAASSEADPASFESSADKTGDLHRVGVGGERYEIYDALILGG